MSKGFRTRGPARCSQQQSRTSFFLAANSLAGRSRHAYMFLALGRDLLQHLGVRRDGLAVDHPRLFRVPRLFHGQHPLWHFASRGVHHVCDAEIEIGTRRGEESSVSVEMVGKNNGESGKLSRLSRLATRRRARIPVQHGRVRACEKGDGVALFASATRTANAVDVLRGVGRKVVVDDHVHAL